ncbi:TPA: hypothetical protein PMC41_003348 [Vibrio cholerae]|uniref:hypothetical protein n=1 Tax=Vibrio cholerae TaxID=666 RepID=UPI0029344777|nr:hypothetical protein [Vibrio cholerae]EKF9707696.1 hypothetical protein [Vibrio cholerae]EKF9720865.1 hypothetical protein [Vibrio cholerae]MDV2337375.1 hypothetical protein [Vibrio cholerae]HDI3283166.1 hypothetical protein [Vibrio cholerae]
MNPKTNALVFGSIPEISFRGSFFIGADIFLRYGEHRGVNRGFGAVHIWAEHSKDLIELGYPTRDDVARFVSDLIRPRCPIYCEFNNPRGNHRLAVLKTAIGVVYLEQTYNQENEPFYSVVTAFPKGKAHGTQIGSVR